MDERAEAGHGPQHASTDQEAEQDAYAAYGVELYRFLLQHTDDSALASALLVRAFLRVFVAGERAAAGRPVRARLFAAADAELRQCEYAGPASAATAEERKAAWIVQEALHRITEQERVVLTEACLRRRTLDEVAAESGVSVPELHGRISLGLGAIRHQLDKLSIGLP